MIIELLYGFTKFQSTLIKPYFINNQEFISNNFVATLISLAKALFTEISQIKILLVNILLIKHIAKLFPKILASLAPIK